MSIAGGRVTGRDCTLGAAETQLRRRPVVKLPHERFDYAPIVSRRPWKLPKGFRIAVWTIVNVEEWSIEKGMPRQYLSTPQGVAVTPDVCESYPPIAQAMLDAKWEFMGHGVVQGAMHLLPDQRAAIGEAVRLIEKFTGKKPKGWLGPGLTETWETLELLREAGIEYVS